MATRSEPTASKCEDKRAEPATTFATDEIKRVARHVAAGATRYRASWSRGLTQLAITVLLFCASLTVMYVSIDGGPWLILVLAVPAAGLLVRLFIIQHDCGHGSFLPSRAANDVVGGMLGVLTFTPYTAWRRDHAIHHASIGNLDRRGHGDLTMLTVDEYNHLPVMKRLGYRLYRHPFVMVLLGAPVNFLLLQRFAVGQSFGDRLAWRSILLLDMALIVTIGGAGTLIGFGTVATIYLPVIVAASWIGNWLFYVQHQFEGAYWQRKGEWDFHIAALCGGSHLDLSPILRWFSGHIGLHHLHHLSSRVPNYRLQAWLDAHPELQHFTRRIGLRESLGCWRLALWDERQARLVSFRDAGPGS